MCLDTKITHGYYILDPTRCYFQGQSIPKSEIFSPLSHSVTRVRSKTAEPVEPEQQVKGKIMFLIIGANRPFNISPLNTGSLLLFNLLLTVKFNCAQSSQHLPQISVPACVHRDEGTPLPGHQPSHQDEPGGAVVEGVLAIAEDIRALLRASVRAGVVHKRFVVNQVRHLALALIRHLRDLGVGGGKGGRGRAVSQVLIDTTVEDGGAERVGNLGTVAKMKER